MWLWGLAERWRVPKKEFAGLDCEGGLLASPDGVGGVLGVGLFGLSECLNHIQREVGATGHHLGSKPLR